MPLTPAPTARETLEQAFDQVVVPEQPTEAPAEPQAEPQATAAVPAEEPKGERPRDEKGQFVKAEKKEEPKPEAKASEAPPKPKAPRPTSWKKEMEQQWDSLDPTLQAYLGEREKQYATGVSTYKTEADRAKVVMTALAPYEAMLQRSNIPVDKWIQQMGIAHHLISAGTPQERVQTVAAIIKNNGIDAQALIQLLSGQQPQFQQQQQTPLPQPTQPPISDADIQAKIEQALMLKDVDRAYKSFMDEVDAGKREHFETVKPTMAKLLESGLAPDYQSAYDIALAMPEHKSLVQPAPQPQTAPAATPVQTKAEAAQRARSQAVSVKSSTPSTMTPASGPKSLRDQLSDSFDSATSRRV